MLRSWKFLILSITLVAGSLWTTHITAQSEWVFLPLVSVSESLQAEEQHATTPDSGTIPGAPIATATPPSDNSLDFPLRITFYYPWFPNAWKQQGKEPFTHYSPSQGLYDSADLSTIQSHIEAMAYGHIQAGIASWWGRGHHTDDRVPQLLRAADSGEFRWALYYEAEGQGDPTAADIQSDLTYIRDTYAIHPNYLRLNNQFVVFVYADVEDGCGMSERWFQANSLEAYVVLKVFPGYRECSKQPAGWHQYAPANAVDSQLGYSYGISPGFWKATESQPRLERNLERWRADIRNMIASDEPFQIILTFNEWGEGSSVESALEWDSPSGYGLYLDALHENGEMMSVPPTQTSENTEAPRLPTATSAPLATSTFISTTTPLPSSTPEFPSPILTSTLSPTPPSQSTVKVQAAADAYVYQSKSSTNYGDQTILRTDRSPKTYSYLRFDVPPFTGIVISATLQVYASSRSSSGFEVRKLTDPAWEEATLTYENAPEDGFVIDSSGPFEENTWVGVNIAQVIEPDRSLSLVLHNLNDTAVSYGSREAGSDFAPRLLIHTQSFSDALPSEEGVVISAVGDIATCARPDDEAVAALFEKIPGPILTLGDTVYESGSVQEFADCFDPAWGRYRERIRPAVGNHEYLTSGAKPYFAYFGEAAGDPEKGYYSYELGAWHIVALNSNCSKVGGCKVDSAQAQWLLEDLQESEARCTLAYMHHPRWSSGRYQVNDNVKSLVEILYDHDVELILAGHAHSYERFAPQDPEGNPDGARGIQQFVVGTGGKNHTSAYVHVLPNSKVRNDDTFGVLTLTLFPMSFKWQFVPVVGGTFWDEGDARCH